MKKKYYIALYLLGIDSETLILIINTLNEIDLKQLFKGNQIEISYKYNLDLKKYISILSDVKLLDMKLKEAQIILDKNKELGIKTIVFNEKFYPIQLRSIKNPPAIIYIKGKNITKKDLKSICCIGTRNPTKQAIEAIDSIIRDLVKEEFTIISGLAYGTDYLAHKKCLELNGRTIAVLAHGLDMVYPSAHENLANEILKKGGTIISEYPVGTKVEKYRFVKRNRIVSGLSSGILMIEGKENSGTRHTVNYGVEQQKQIFCPIFNKYSEYNKLNSLLLKHNVALGIGPGEEYIKIINRLGFKVKYDRNNYRKLKEKQVKDILKNVNIQNVSLDKNCLEVSKTGFSIEKETYNKFKKILKENDLTIKDFFNYFINGMVKSFEEE
ncbi:DNA-processing protein DprA [Clostridium thermobutyricum]|uniref:DNA-processing protein DprA n=1 Tax=Clostridium thermobutyricum TaxID=29372 RepID=UPI002941C6C3|nr:DNA-processing protein DprA [Clostridium thermobutyricum]